MRKNGGNRRGGGGFLCKYIVEEKRREGERVSERVRVKKEWRGYAERETPSGRKTSHNLQTNIAASLTAPMTSAN